MRLAAWLAAALVAASTLFVGHRFSGALKAAAAEPSRVRILAETIPGSVPPEFASDLLIRIADSPAGAKEGTAWRATVYEQAFELAGSAQESAPYFRPVG